MSEDIYAQIEITPFEVSEQLARGGKFLFVGVREKWEHDASRIETATLIPLREILANLARLEEAEEVVLFCHHGMRSVDAAEWLRSQGVGGARSMAGGIEPWSVEIDPRVRRY